MATYRLNDEQMRGFIRDGYVAVKTDLPAEYHQDIWDQTDALFESEGNPGNNLMARIPALRRVFDDPAVDGALTSVLGPNYYMHPHRYCHYRPPGGEGQQMHKDSFTKRQHHTRWVLAMYYPQNTTEDMGPTAVMPGSQYYNWLKGPIGARRLVDGTEGEVPMPVDAGTVLFVHYDIWHRGMPNLSDKKRYMIKYMFTRMEEPQGPSWESEQPDWVPGDDDRHRAMWTHMWRWHYGANNGESAGNGQAVDRMPHLIKSLQVDTEATCLNAAYDLATMGESAVPALIDLLQHESEAVRRNAGYALSAIGGPAVEALSTASQDADPDTRSAAVETLGDIGLAASEAEPLLNKALQDESVQVRRYAAEALGTTSQLTSDGSGGLSGALSDEDGYVRRNAALALARIGPRAQDATSALAAALEDQDRYVRGKAAHALHRIGSPQAQDALMRFLTTSQWCHSTTSDSPY